jgi:hypothetical protein
MADEGKDERDFRRTPEMMLPVLVEGQERRLAFSEQHINEARKQWIYGLVALAQKPSWESLAHAIKREGEMESALAPADERGGFWRIRCEKEAEKIEQLGALAGKMGSEDEPVPEGKEMVLAKVDEYRMLLDKHNDKPGAKRVDLNALNEFRDGVARKVGVATVEAGK